MQQFSRVCMIAGHDQKYIEYVCLYHECSLCRFLCSKCTKIGNHKHQQYDQSHIFDNNELQEFLKEKIININKDPKLQTQDTFKKIIQEMNSILQNIRVMIDKIQNYFESKSNVQSLNDLLLNLNNNGFNQFDDSQLKILVNFDKQIGDIHTQMSDQSKHIIQNLIRIQQICYSQQIYSSGIWDQKIKDAQQNLITQDQTFGDFQILSSAISNDYKYIVSGGTDQQLNIWNYNNNKLVQSIQLANWITSIRITDDSKLIYVAQRHIIKQYTKWLYLIYVVQLIQQFQHHQQTKLQQKHISSSNSNYQKQMLIIDGLDYDYYRNIIASSSYDRSIKLWNATNGQLVLEKQNAHNNQCRFIQQVLFIIKKKQLISLDNSCNLIIWNVDYENKELEQLKKIYDKKGIYNISLVIDQQYITVFCSKYIKIYSIRGDMIKQINHDVEQLIMINLIQPQSMKALIIEGQKTLKICKFNIN